MPFVIASAVSKGLRQGQSGPFLEAKGEVLRDASVSLGWRGQREGLVIKELNSKNLVMPRKRLYLGVGRHGLAACALGLMLGTALGGLKRRRCYLPVVEVVRQQVTLSRRSVLA